MLPSQRIETPGDIPDDATLEDLGLDSIDIAELSIMLEDSVEIQKTDTVADILNLSEHSE